MLTYQLTQDPNVVLFQPNGKDRGSTEIRSTGPRWRHYQDWLADGNTPDPSEPLPPPPVTPAELKDGNGAISRAEMNDLKSYLRARFGFS